MHLVFLKVFASVCLAVSLGCAADPPDEQPTLFSGLYKLDTLNLETNGCAMTADPLDSIHVEADATDKRLLRFPDNMIGGEEITTPSATIVDGGFELTFSGVVSTRAYDDDGAVDCTFNVRFDLEATIVDESTWSIDAGTHTLEPVIGPADLCGEAIQSGLDAPGYDPIKGCSRTFTATMRRSFDD